MLSVRVVCGWGVGMRCGWRQAERRGPTDSRGVLVLILSPLVGFALVPGSVERGKRAACEEATNDAWPFLGESAAAPIAAADANPQSDQSTSSHPPHDQTTGRRVKEEA